MSKLTTTFSLLRQKSACSSGYAKLAKHLGGVGKYGARTPIDLLTILESNGVNDCLWSFRATVETDDYTKRMVAADIAESVLHLYENKYPDDPRPRKAIEAARQRAKGEITDAAAYDAYAAAADAAAAAAYAAAAAAAADAAAAAAYAAYAADAADAAAYDVYAAAADAAARTKEKQALIVKSWLS